MKQNISFKWIIKHQIKAQSGFKFYLPIFLFGIWTLNVPNTHGRHLLTLIRCSQKAPWQSHAMVTVVQITKNYKRTSHSRENFRAKTFLELPFQVKQMLLILYESSILLCISVIKRYWPLLFNSIEYLNLKMWAIKYYWQTGYFPKLVRDIWKITSNLSQIRPAHFLRVPYMLSTYLVWECTFKQHDLGKTASLILSCLLLSNTQKARN